mgnify:CR=1 FL=1
MSALTPEQISAIDAAHVWHPYSTIGAEAMAPVVALAADGAWLTLSRDGREVRVLDAMASWWTAVHGHGHPVLDAALTRLADPSYAAQLRSSVRPLDESGPWAHYVGALEALASAESDAIGDRPVPPPANSIEIGRASCRERV